MDNDLNFYVADRKGNRIVIYDEFGTYLRDIKPNLLYQPLAMAFQNENLWILHTADRQIVVTDLEGNLINQFGPLLSGSEVPLVSPTDLSFNSDGQLLIVDPRSNRVIICDVIYDDEEQEKKN